MRMLSRVVSAVLIVGVSGDAIGADTPLFKFKGKTFTSGSIDTKEQQQLYDIQHDSHHKMEQFVDQLILNAYFDEEAAKSKKPRAQVEQDLLGVKDPTEKEMKEMFDKNAGKMPYKYEDIKADLKNFMIQQKMAEKRQSVVADLKKSGKAESLLVEPEAPVVDVKTDGFPFKGKGDAKVTIVEFADFQCPHCRAAQTTVKKVVDEFKDKVKFVFLDFPINRSGISRTVAEGAACANEQGKYWEYHSLAFEKQSELTKDSPAKLAGDLKLDAGKFKQCMDSEKPKEIVKKAEAEGARVGVAGTPTIFVNGRKITTHNEDDLRNAVKKALKG